LTLVYLQLIVVPYEEIELQKTFGDSYKQYFARVHRWI